MPKRPMRYWFGVPTLPKEIYTLVREVMARDELTAWQTVILAVACLDSVSKRDPKGYDIAVGRVKQRYPAARPEIDPEEAGR